MKQKPIKRNPNILLLSKDHHFTLLFCWKIREGLKHAVDPERIKKYVQHFWNTNMLAHFREEEIILFSKVVDEKVQNAINDHHSIEEQVEQITQSPLNGSTTSLSKLAEMVDTHVRYEERELFPYLERQLTADQLETIGKELKYKQVLQDDYPDEFWVKN
ncbi:MAG: hemerythrin domain-containing protein [Candidatus Dadabacteria bacterium]